MKKIVCLLFAACALLGSTFLVGGVMAIEQEVQTIRRGEINFQVPKCIRCVPFHKYFFDAVKEFPFGIMYGDGGFLSYIVEVDLVNAGFIKIVGSLLFHNSTKTFLLDEESFTRELNAGEEVFLRDIFEYAFTYSVAKVFLTA